MTSLRSALRRHYKNRKQATRIGIRGVLQRTKIRYASDTEHPRAVRTFFRIALILT